MNTHERYRDYNNNDHNLIIKTFMHCSCVYKHHMKQTFLLNNFCILFILKSISAYIGP
jgi:hypothetical protein